jgi:L-alanine-DL-glutamate epimerase-like enolase superfamily enzyme
VTIGAAELFVDANGGYRVHEALHLLDACQDSPLRWFEEPVSADDAPGLRQVRATAAAGPEIAAGEYTFTLDDATRLLEAQDVDVLPAGVTRCGGITGLRKGRDLVRRLVSPAVRALCASAPPGRGRFGGRPAPPGMV